MATPTELTQAFVASTGAMVCVVDGVGRIQLVNPALERFTGLPAAELLGRVFWDVWVPPEQVAHVQEAVAVAMVGGRSVAVEGDWLAADGSRRRVAMQNSVLRDAAGHAFAIASVGIDVTETHRRASTDSLTGAANRAALFEELRKRLDRERGSGCGLVFCDVDAFKAVNDVHGHLVGDRLLVEVAQRLRNAADEEQMVARFGGDEFVVLHPSPDADALTALAGRMAEQLRVPLPDQLRALPLQVSIGLALGQAGEHPDVVMTRADRSMYRSKHRRRLTRG
ncbi:diguanylate cyclase [Blastococcus sp. MG754426]|nr:diguanylate cyclase [Blastococcus sp. MG754426]MCF6513885.1 diguanylate cyclase [Blastococcus sp. MG754427]